MQTSLGLGTAASSHRASPWRSRQGDAPDIHPTFADRIALENVPVILPRSTTECGTARPQTTFNAPGPLGTAVLFLVFNRPLTTARVMDAIRQAKPPRLYVAADGPRSHKKGEAASCAEVLRIATAVDWPCQVQTLVRSENAGCKLAVSEAISWFFEHEEQGVILEDDCLPSQSFFWFCEVLLNRYAKDARIMSIGGSNFQGNNLYDDTSYFATKHFHCWGWASWRRAWAQYDRNLQYTSPAIDKGLDLVSDGNFLFPRYWRRILDDCRKGRNSSWAYPMALTCFARTGGGRETLHLAPETNLVANIGFDIHGTHTISTASNPAQLAHDLAWPLRHPSEIRRCIAADRATDRSVFGITWKNAVRRELVQRFPWAATAYRRVLRNE